MADFQRWDRQLLPQGGLVAPQTGPSLAESFAQGLTDVASTAAKAVESVRQTDEWRDQKQWEIDQPKAAAIVNKLQLDIAGQLPELKAKAAPGLADYPDTIDDAITRATEEALKDNPDPRFQRYVHAYMDDFRVSTIATGIQEKTAATLAHDASSLQQLLDGQSTRVSKSFGDFDSAAKLFDDTVVANQHFSADQKSEFSRLGKRALAIAGLNGLVDRDPDAADKILASGKLDDVLSLDDRQSYAATIKSERQRSKQAADLAIAQQNDQRVADANAGLRKAFRDAEEKGKYDPGTRDLVRKAFPDESKEILQELDIKRFTGLDNLVIPTQSAEADQRLLDDATLQLSADTHNPVLIARYTNVKQKLAEKYAALQSNPEEYVRLHTPAVKEKWAAFVANPRDWGTTQDALETSVQVQRSQGVLPEGIQPVPQEVGDGAVEQAKQIGPDAIADFQQNFGYYYPHLMARIAPKYGPYITTAFILDQPSQRPTQVALLELSRDPQAVHSLEQNLAVDDSLRAGIQKALFRNFDSVRKSYLAQVGGDAVFPKLSDSAYALTLFYMRHDGQDAEAAASRAAREIATDHYAFGYVNGRVYRVPVGYSADSVARGAKLYLANLANRPLDRPIDHPTMEPETIARSLQQYGWWSTLPDESGLALHYQDGTEAATSGKAIKVSWRQLELLASHHPEARYPTSSRFHQ